MNKLALFDYDNTLAMGFAVPDVCKLMEKSNLGNKGFAKSWDELLSDYESGRIEYNTMVDKSEIVIGNFLKGVSTNEFMKFIREQYKPLDYLNAWVEPLFDLLRKNGWHTAIISGAINEFLEVVQELLDVDFIWGSRVHKKGSLFTTDFNVVMNHQEKAKIVKELVPSFEKSFGMGDSEGDLEFLKLVDSAFVYSPQPVFASMLKDKYPQIIIIEDGQAIEKLTKTLV